MTDVAIRNAKPGAKAVKLADGNGMFLLVTPAGCKLWRLKFRIDGREKLLATFNDSYLLPGFDLRRHVLMAVTPGDQHYCIDGRTVSAGCWLLAGVCSLHSSKPPQRSPA